MGERVDRTFPPYLALSLAMVFWGISYIWTKVVFTAYRPITTIFLRLLISTAVLWTSSMVFRQLKKPTRKEMKQLALLSLFQPFLYFLGESYGLYYVSTIVAAVCVATIPLFTPIAGYFFFREKLKPMNFAGIGVSILGVVMVVMKGDFTISASPKGILFLGLAVAAAIAYSVMVLRLSNRCSTLVLVTWQNTWGALYFMIPFLLFEWQPFVAARPTVSVLTSLLMLAVFSSSAAFMLFVFGVKKIGISRANTFSNMIPVFTALFSYLILGEIMIPLNIAGIGLVVAGLFLAQMRPSSSRK